MAAGATLFFRALLKPLSDRFAPQRSPGAGRGMESLSRRVGDTEYGRLLEWLADQLDRDPQPAVAKAGAHRDRRVTGDGERHYKAGVFEQVPL